MHESLRIKSKNLTYEKLYIDNNIIIIRIGGRSVYSEYTRVYWRRVNTIIDVFGHYTPRNFDGVQLLVHNRYTTTVVYTTLFGTLHRDVSYRAYRDCIYIPKIQTPSDIIIYYFVYRYTVDDVFSALAGYPRSVAQIGGGKTSRSQFKKCVIIN